ncbi:SusC/RagA family TonB-linked outer membrane protein [uncultured Algibacter sp.]|uniref:SusC/RagA family TonB-linked outer membrane protein n=1 Tax=uncultured Algibacter sp. TaxID=298659 RepID=UPI00262EED2B|nr:SusC/RagA family TonB-linked outer membrane protein [uncultured Algibacter sp.]
MKTKFSGILTLLLAFVVQLTFAQEKTISGTVSDGSGLPLPGATVLVKGTSSGTSSDFDGNYSIKANQGSTLVFSFVGYTTKEVSVGASNTINVTLQEDAQALEEVIVTAFGIERKPKELAYSTVELDEEILVQAAPVSIESALIGKSTGLNINFNNNGVNPTTTVRLRANNSLSQNNNALIVVDGVPQSDSSLGDLNPQDIANVTILKGATSVTLYGSKGANGAIIVTTKRGKNSEKINVSINSAVTFTEVKFFPETQSEFGSGSSNVFDYNPIENESWGPRYDGTLRQVGPTLPDGTFQVLPYAPVKEGRQSFFETGITTQNGISLSGGNENATYFFSAQRVDTKGVTPGDKYTKDNFRFNGSMKSGKLETSTNISFFQDKTNVAGASPSDGSFYRILLNTPAHYRLSDYRNWRTDLYSTPETYFNAFFKNPYQIVDQNRDNSRTNRLQGVVNLKYNFNDWLSASYTLGGTWFNSEFKNTNEAYTYAPTTYTRPDDEVNAVRDGMRNDFRLNSDLFLTLEKDLNEDFSLRFLVGTHVESRRNNQINISSNNLFTNVIYNANVRTGNLDFDNVNFNSPQGVFMKRLYSYMADTTVGFRDFLFLSGSWRQDTSSTLPVENNTYSYFSGGLSFVATDAFPSIKSDVLSFLKFNASYAKVGNDAGIGLTNENFITPTGFPFGTTPGLRNTTRAVDPNLSPEFSYSTEFGLRAEFFKSRVRLEANYYDVESEDQINNSTISATSGALTFLTNLGVISNKGIEIDFGFTPIQTEDFEWDVNFNYSFNDSNVESLADGTLAQGVQTSFQNTAALEAQVGNPFPQLTAPGYTRDAQGRIVVNENGDPFATNEFVNLGSTVPDVIMGLNTKIRYKNLSLRAVADYKTGHVFYSTLVEALEFAGLTTQSASTNRQPFIFPNSVYETAPGSGVFVENTDRPTSGGTRQFWQNAYNNIKENYVVDATALKIREIALDYNFPSKLLKNTSIEAITVGLIANNLFMFRPDENRYTDPEFSINTTGSGTTGIGSSAQAPPTGSYGMKVNIKF